MNEYQCYCYTYDLWICNVVGSVVSYYYKTRMLMLRISESHPVNLCMTCLHVFEGLPQLITLRSCSHVTLLPVCQKGRTIQYNTIEGQQVRSHLKSLFISIQPHLLAGRHVKDTSQFQRKDQRTQSLHWVHHYQKCHCIYKINYIQYSCFTVHVCISVYNIPGMCIIFRFGTCQT